MNSAWDVMELPAAIVAKHGQTVRRGEAYNAAHEEFRIAVETACWDAHTPIPAAPWDKASLTVVCYVGRARNDGKYRPDCTNRLHDALDPVYRALINLGFVASMKAIPDIRTILVSDAVGPTEGFRIILEAE